MEDWDELLQGSPAYIVYDEFNSTLAMDGYENDFQRVINMKNNDRRIKNLCGKVVANLSNISKLYRYAPNKREYCMQLHFWLYDQIVKIFKPDIMENTEIVGILNAMFDGWYKYNSHSSNVTCSAKYSTSATFEEWKSGKILHDYFKNFQHITDNYTSGNDKCEQYRKYLQYINEQYREYKNKCSHDGMAPCNNYYTDIDKYNPNNLLPKFSCEIQNAFKAISAGPTGDIGETSETPGFQAALEMENVQDIIVTSVSVHNLTPLGHWLRTRLLSKKIIDHNTYEEEENEFLVNIYDLENRIHDNSGHNIGYNALNRI
ncbi:PIR protein [Plasmodium ovale]|uniref:PIR protein n=1 Tax=Plasmodium ovale TaxID=36330 RepID=A0A1D3JG46_PLAOA|nr:PIR protein [Plasmodium ovale]